MCSAKHYTCPQKAVQNYNYISDWTSITIIFSPSQAIYLNNKYKKRPYPCRKTSVKAYIAT